VTGAADQSKRWNPRYAAYAKAHDRAPEQMILDDDERWPGGCMTGFILWVSGKWRTWNELNGWPQNEPHGEEQQDAFDVWIGATP
jgi:hypothetical protein